MKQLEERLKLYIDDIKRDLLFFIISNMRKEELTMEEAEDMCSSFLTPGEFLSIEDVLKRLFLLSRNYKEARAVFVKYGKEYDREKSDYLLSRVHPYITQRNVEDAVMILKGEFVWKQ